ncbi:hypothetical protein D3C80_1653450 [compost metagenome]
MAQASEHQLDIPGFEHGASVQVQAEAAGDINRFPDDQHPHVENVGQVFQPTPVPGHRADQRLPAPVNRDLLWQEQIKQHHQANP